MHTMNFQEFMDSVLADKTLDFTKDGKCSGCGNCCSRILPISEKEIKRIRHYIKQNNIRECVHCAPRVIDLDMTCPFLNSQNRCTIYEVRPQICKSFLCCMSGGAIKANREEFHDMYGVVDMKETFFGSGRN